MPRIRLSYWHGGHAPGDVIDVDADALKALARDGRVAEVLPDEVAEPAPEAAVEAPAEEPEAAAPTPRRRKSAPQEE